MFQTDFLNKYCIGFWAGIITLIGVIFMTFVFNQLFGGWFWGFPAAIAFMVFAGRPAREGGKFLWQHGADCDGN